MSMLSEQVNELRMLADKLRNVHARQGDDYVESCETLYWSMCAMLDAADTILSLRDRLQDAELGSSTLTAEQVREAIRKYAEDDSCYIFEVYGEMCGPIADELNAELGSGTCEWATDSEGVRIDVADTVHMLRSEYDGDHEWDDVVIELAYCKHGGDRWIVRGARGEALACDCTVTGHDDELYDERA